MTRLSFFALVSCLALGFSATFTSGKDATTNSGPAMIAAPAATSPVAATPVTNPAAPAVAKPAAKNDDDGDDDDSDSLVKIRMGDHHDSPFVEDVIPIFVVGTVFGTPIVIVFVIVYFRFRQRQEMLATVREYVSKGLPVPAEILTSGNFRPNENPVDLSPKMAGRCDIRRGVKLIFIGAAISVGLYFLSSHHHGWASGLIVTVIGFGYLAVGFFEMNQDQRNVRPPGSPLS